MKVETARVTEKTRSVYDIELYQDSNDNWFAVARKRTGGKATMLLSDTFTHPSECINEVISKMPPETKG
jgi:hypothetical protein